jgi:ATP-dependent protease ClpP protease subunit
MFLPHQSKRTDKEGVKMKLLFLLMFLLSFGLQAETVNLNNDNTVFLNDVVYSESITQAMGELSAKESNSEPVIYLVLDTPGGSVFAGLSLIHYLKGYKKPVKTVTIFAASMGFQIAMGNPGDRLVVDTGILMSHPMKGNLGGELGDGLSTDNRNGYIKEVIATMDKAAVARTNGKQTLESYRKAYDNELWTTGANAVAAGYADGLGTVNCSPELTNSVKKFESREWLRGSPMALEIKYETSKCPLMLSMLRYQVSLIDIVGGRRFILDSSGYPTEAASETESENKVSNSSTTRSINNSVGFTLQDIQKTLDSSLRYKAFQFYQNRKLENMKGMDWL